MVKKLKPYQQRTRGCLCGAGAGMNLAGEGCMAFPVQALSCEEHNIFASRYELNLCRLNF